MKTIFKNKTNKIITLVIVLISMTSFGVIMQSCSQEDESTELDIFKDLPFLSFSAEINSNMVDLPEEDERILVSAFQRINLIEKDGFYQMLETSANQINVSKEVFIYLNDLVKKSNERILEYSRKSSLIPRLKNGDENENETSNYCVAETIVNIAQSMGVTLNFSVVNGWIGQQYGINGVPSGNILDVVSHYFSSSSVSISEGYTPPSGKQVFVVFNFGDGTGHAARYQSCSNGNVLCAPFYIGSLSQVSSAYLISGVY